MPASLEQSNGPVLGAGQAMEVEDDSHPTRMQPLEGMRILF